MGSLTALCASGTLRSIIRNLPNTALALTGPVAIIRSRVSIFPQRARRDNGADVDQNEHIGRTPAQRANCRSSGTRSRRFEAENAERAG